MNARDTDSRTETRDVPQRRTHARNIELPSDRENVKELTVAVLGNANSGKSTLTGILTNPAFPTAKSVDELLDDGNGKARRDVLQFSHEQETGRTSSVTYKHMVLDGGYKIIRFVDLAGHESYLKTTITGMTSTYPDYAFVCVEKNITNTTSEHLAIVLSLDVPFTVLMTKVDIMPEAKIKMNVKRIFKLLKRIGKRAIIIKNKKDLEFFNDNPTALNVVPIVLISNVSGYGLNNVLRVLNFVEKRNAKIVPGAFVIDSIFNVLGFGIVVSGITSIDIQRGDDMFLGPFSGSRTGSEYIKTKVRTIHDGYRNFVDVLPAGTRGCLCIRIIEFHRRRLRSGMVLAKSIADVHAVRRFKARIQIFDGHATTIRAGYSAVINSGMIKSTAIFTNIENGIDCLRSGDSAVVDVEFLRHKYCVVPGEKFIFREGGVRGIGEII